MSNLKNQPVASNPLGMFQTSTVKQPNSEENAFNSVDPLSQDFSKIMEAIDKMFGVKHDPELLIAGTLISKLTDALHALNQFSHHQEQPQESYVQAPKFKL